jgi:hypothetical protein
MDPEDYKPAQLATVSSEWRVRCGEADDNSSLYTSISVPKPVFIKAGESIYPFHPSDSVQVHGWISRYYSAITRYAPNSGNVQELICPGLFEPQDITQKPSIELFCKNLEAWNEPFKGADTKDTQ